MKRFREKRIPDDGKYVLWMDIYALFPYDYEKVSARIGLWEGNREAQVCYGSEIKITHPLPNSQWLSIVRKEEKDPEYQYGIPFYFKTYGELQRISSVSFTFIFSYYNAEHEYNRLVIHVMESINIEKEAGEMDYVMEKKCTSIPSIMEQQNNYVRRNILDGYDEVLHAKAELFDKRANIPIYINRIKSQGNMSDEVSYCIARDTLTYINAMLGAPIYKNVYMSILMNQASSILRPVTGETMAFLIGGAE